MSTSAKATPAFWQGTFEIIVRHVNHFQRSRNDHCVGEAAGGNRASQCVAVDFRPQPFRQRAGEPSFCELKSVNVFKSPPRRWESTDKVVAIAADFDSSNDNFRANNTLWYIRQTACDAEVIDVELDSARRTGDEAPFTEVCTCPKRTQN